MKGSEPLKLSKNVTGLRVCFLFCSLLLVRAFFFVLILFSKQFMQQKKDSGLLKDMRSRNTVSRTQSSDSNKENDEVELSAEPGTNIIIDHSLPLARYGIGRKSFGNYNPIVEKDMKAQMRELQERLREQCGKKDRTAEPRSFGKAIPDGVDISNEEMAKVWSEYDTKHGRVNNPTKYFSAGGGSLDATRAKQKSRKKKSSEGSKKVESEEEEEEDVMELDTSSSNEDEDDDDEDSSDESSSDSDVEVVARTEARKKNPHKASMKRPNVNDDVYRKKRIKKR